MNLKKITFILVAIFSFIYVLVTQKYIQRVNIATGYVQNFTVNRGEDVIAYLQPEKELKSAYLTIHNIRGVAVDSIKCELKFQDTLNKSKIYELGFGFKHVTKYNTSKLKSGIYLLGNLVPFQVKENSNANKIAIVLPYLALNATNSQGGKSFYTYASSDNIAAKKLSLNRCNTIDNCTIDFLEWMEVNFSNQYEIITDVEYQKNTSVRNWKLLILYNNLSFVTFDFKKKVEKDILDGLNVFVISSTFMQNILYFNEKKGEILYDADDTNSTNAKDEFRTGLASNTYFNDQNILQFGLDNFLVNKEKLSSIPNDEFVFMNNSSSILNELKFPKSNLKMFDVKSLSGTWLNFSKHNKEYSLKMFRDYSNFQILAETKHLIGNDDSFLGNIIYMKKTSTSGQQISIGCNDWFSRQNLFRDTNSTITREMINYLLK